jgi:hypothetical protein
MVQLKKKRKILVVRTVIFPKKHFKTSIWYLVVTYNIKVKLFFLDCIGYVDHKYGTKQLSVNGEKCGYWLNRGVIISLHSAFLFGVSAQFHVIRSKIKNLWN